MDSLSPRPEAALGLLVHDVARLMRRRFEQRAREAQLPLSRNLCSVLLYVAREEGMSQVRLAHLLDIEPITLVRLIDRLEESGLIERRLNPRDRRVWMLYLTAAAGPVLKQIHDLTQTVREEAFAELPEAGRQALIGMLQQLKANLCGKRSVDADEGEEPRAGSSTHR